MSVTVRADAMVSGLVEYFNKSRTYSVAALARVGFFVFRLFLGQSISALQSGDNVTEWV